MKCPQCQFENPDGIKYCGDCGTRIENSCPKCNYINPPQFKFCGSCGHKLEKPSPQEKPIPPSESERKLITVLFSDMSGYKISKRLSEPNNPYRELNGISAAE